MRSEDEVADSRRVEDALCETVTGLAPLFTKRNMRLASTRRLSAQQKGVELPEVQLLLEEKSRIKQAELGVVLRRTLVERVALSMHGRMLLQRQHKGGRKELSAALFELAHQMPAAKRIEEACLLRVLGGTIGV